MNASDCPRSWLLLQLSWSLLLVLAGHHNLAHFPIPLIQILQNRQQHSGREKYKYIPTRLLMTQYLNDSVVLSHTSSEVQRARLFIPRARCYQAYIPFALLVSPDLAFVCGIILFYKGCLTFLSFGFVIYF